MAALVGQAHARWRSQSKQSLSPERLENVRKTPPKNWQKMAVFGDLFCHFAVLETDPIPRRPAMSDALWRSDRNRLVPNGL
jgi:hypothetical protein